MNNIDTLEAVIKTLNDIPTRGKENLDHLLACIVGCEQVAQSLREEQNNGNK